MTSANEYVRGVTLRFLSKIKEQELIEPLVKPIIECLTHRHSFVRRNAVLTVFSIFTNFESLIPDAPELVEAFLDSEESDISAKRNAFIMLVNCDQERAVKYLRENIDKISTSGDIFQLSLLNLLRKMCKTYPNEKSKYLRVISSLLDSKSPAVLYQCAGTLISLSSSPIAIKAASNCYTQLLLSHSDNNIKLIVLDRLVNLKERYPDVMQTIVMDVLRALSNPTMDVKKKVLEITLDIISKRNIDDVFGALKKELIRTDENLDPKLVKSYKTLLIKTFHECVNKFPEIASNILFCLDFIGEPFGLSVATLARDLIENHPKLRSQIIDRLCSGFNLIKSSKIFCVVLWIFGTYSESKEQISNVFSTIISSVDDKKEDEKLLGQSTQPKVRADGTYVTESRIEQTIKEEQKVINLKTLISEGDYFLISVICTTLSKLCLFELEGSQVSEAILTMCKLVKIGSVSNNYIIDKDTLERIGLCVKLLTTDSKEPREILTKETKEIFSSILKNKLEKKKTQEELDLKEKNKTQQVDSLLNITQLKGKKFDAFEYEEEDLLLATSNIEKNSGLSKLNKVTQLTGFSDPVYSEATVTIHQFDIVLNVLVVNQTNDTLQNLTLEISTVGDLKLCERPSTITLGPFASTTMKVSVKVSSTENGLIFGNIIYDVSGSSGDSKCIILNEIRVDIMDYIQPSHCDDSKFRSMWFEFDWENKIVVSSTKELKDYLEYICGATHMNCLTNDAALLGDCEFLSANLYAKSSFGEDALANLSLEKRDGKVSGFFRIRSKAQGIAAALGEKVHKLQQNKE